MTTTRFLKFSFPPAWGKVRMGMMALLLGAGAILSTPHPMQAQQDVQMSTAPASANANKANMTLAPGTIQAEVSTAPAIGNASKAMTPALVNGELDALVNRRLAAIKFASGSKRYESTGQLGNDLSDAFNHGHQMSDGIRERLCNGLISVYKDLGSSQDDIGTKQEIVAIETGHCNSAASEKFVFHVMETGPDTLRRFILTYLGDPDGLRGEDVYSKLDEWSTKGYMKKSARPIYWVRMKGEKAVPDILRVINESEDKEDIIYAARALQDVGSVEDMKVAYRKSLAVGLQKPYKDFSDGLYWVNGRKLTHYVKEVHGPDLDVILKLMGASDALIPAEVVPVLTEKLKTSNGETERLIVERLLEAAKNPRIDHDEMIRSLQAKMSAEPDSGARKQLAKAITQVREQKAAAAQFFGQEQEWIRKNRR